MILSFSQLLGVWPKWWGRHHFYWSKLREAKNSPSPGSWSRRRTLGGIGYSQADPCFFVCFIFCRVNILKISFKRKKFFIHQRQKQVSSIYACFVSCFWAVSALKSSAGEGTLPHVLTGREEHGIWWKEKGSQSPEDPAFLCIPRSAYLIGEVACFGVRDIGFRS